MKGHFVFINSVPFETQRHKGWDNQLPTGSLQVQQEKRGVEERDLAVGEGCLVLQVWVWGACISAHSSLWREKVSIPRAWLGTQWAYGSALTMLPGPLHGLGETNPSISVLSRLTHGGEWEEFLK